ncbi:hypothetical protein [Actinomadura algeriensis]|uniref:Uncharacterized protein n=1 Tax=Actinomadura algeriensis TaxID=1679523 RepID=A0ABR9K2W2_9ACTN|nr:hypothetical protein [Actinomadura algeriensis]MBE1537157.1 hypothetical protein [Actinomadura algeriensis]
MSSEGGVRPGTEIREYLLGRLDHALRRPGMMGGEAALLMLIDHLLFAEGREEAWKEQERHWERTGTWTTLRVAGAFRSRIPRKEEDHCVASVYGEFARRSGWLASDRVLDEREYTALRGTAGRWAREDRAWADVVAEFGEPSVRFGGSNPRYGKTLGYHGEEPGDPMVCFHLADGGSGGAPGGDAMLLAVRCEDGAPFAGTFAFTPRGRALRPRGRA